MKIGIDARNLIRPFNGIGRYLLEMSNYLADAGHELVFYSPEPPAKDIESLPGILRVHRSGPVSDLGRHMWGQTVLPKQIGTDGLDVFWGPAHRLPVRSPAALARVVTIHDLVWHYYGHTMRRSGRLADRVLMPLATKSADLVVADSKATAASLQEVLSVSSDKIRVVYPGTRPPLPVDEVFTHPAIPADGSFMLFVGTLEPRKNLERLLLAFSHLKPEERAKCPLMIAGAAGWRHRNVEDIVDALGLSDSVYVLGFVSEGMLAALYNQCKFAAFPSLYEGFGFPIVEANKYGKPVLTSSTSSMVEVAGSAGLLVDPLDVAAITKGILTLISDNGLYRDLADKAPANALRFDWKASADRLTSVFVEARERRANIRK
jgi:glycosyltransferase involved in cell wall biosynthesis